MNLSTPHASRAARPVRGLRVGTVLLLVAIIPLAGLGAAMWQAIGDARDVADAAERTQVLAQDAVGMAEVDTAVFDEMVWTAVNSVIATLGAPEALIAAYVGTDPGGELEDAVARTDEMLAGVELPEVARALADARATDLDLRGVIAVYGAITTQVEAPLRATLDQLASAPAGSSDTTALAAAVRVLDLAVSTRATMADEFYGYFAAIYDVRGTPADEVAGLIRNRRVYDDAIDELTGVDINDPALRDSIAALATDPNLEAFVDTVDAKIADAFAEGLPPVSEEMSFQSVLVNIEGLSDVLQAMGASSPSTLAVLDAAVLGVLDAAQSVRDDADADIRLTYGLALALVGASFVTALVAARFIVRPLRALRRAAHDLQTNQESGERAPAGGPAEVKAAAQAIEDAAAHFDLVTRQARALATGDLDATVLDEQAQGGLGAALQHAVGTLRTALSQQDEFRRRLAHEASHDGLTKLANRNASMAQLTRSLARTHRSGSKLAVLFIDLDHFKDVNDHHGHQAGDAVLTAVSQRLVTSVREGDHVGRLGGDEFVVIAEPVSGIDETVRLAERVLERLTDPIDLPVGRAAIGASIGIALADGEHLTADELLRDADLAVYRAKSLGRGGIEICDEDLRNEMAESADLTVAIRHAIDHDEFVVHYQPIVDTGSEHLHALEALVRWDRPGQDGLVPPDRFIGFAERSALIIDLDCWVLDAVVRQIAEWNADPQHEPVPVAINVSGRHLAHDRFVDHVLDPLARYGVSPQSIIIEVTESALLDDLASAALKLQQLRDRGVLVSIDDFGTGYTSLAHLRSLPVDILKIDRSFTANAATNPHEASIVKLIIDTGHLLGATITAEGVENVAEADKLAGLGTDNLQGFYFARPQPPEQVRSAGSRSRADRTGGPTPP